MFETLDCLVRAPTFPIPAFIDLVSYPFGAFGHKDDGASFLYGLSRIVKSLVCLEKVDIFRKASAGNYYRISRLYRYLVHGIHNLYAFPVGLDKVSGNGSNYLFFAVKHHIQDKIKAGNFCGFFHVLPDRAIDSSGNSLFLYHHFVVCEDSLLRTYTRKY